MSVNSPNFDSSQDFIFRYRNNKVRYKNMWLVVWLWARASFFEFTKSDVMIVLEWNIYNSGTRELVWMALW